MKKISVFLVLLVLTLCTTGCFHQHSFSEKVIQESTCIKEGLIKYTCNECDYSYEEATPKSEHEYIDTAIVVATCTEDGVSKFTCKHCNHSYEEKVEAGHQLEEEILSESTCTSSGRKYVSCKNCDYSETFTLSKKSHRFIANECIYCNAYKADISANTWYTYRDLSSLKVQNCIVSNATTMNGGRAVLASFYPVCATCHIPSKSLDMAAPEINYPVYKTYYCSDCDTSTNITLKISSY